MRVVSLLLRAAPVALLGFCACSSSLPPPETGAGWLRDGKPGGACADLGGEALEAKPAGWVEPATVSDKSKLSLEVRSDRGRRRISYYIYGSNGAKDIQRNRQSVVRSGGNRLTAYNWENNASNAGSDWHFQNDGSMSQSSEPGAALLEMLDDARANGAAAILTVPIVDYVAADRTGDGDVRSRKNYLQERFKQNRPKKPTELSLTPDANDAYVYQDEFVHWAKERAQGAKVIFSLDNEPDLWSSTHAEVHPMKVSYEELVDRNVRFAKAIKDTWPEAPTLGFVSYGWHGYMTLQDAAGGESNGPFVDYYLREMRKAEAKEGRRLVDYLDLHWYPEAQGGGQRIVLNQTSLSDVGEARLEAPRSLWDPTYTEKSWIADSLKEPIRLIPRIQESIEKNYPGTKLAFTEWNYGGGDDITGALAAADVLGIFGCEGVHLATYWGVSQTEKYFFAALRAYRNFDGQGGRYGDTALFAQTSNAAATSLYASISSRDPKKMTVIAINKLPREEASVLSIAHTTEYKTADVYTLTAAGTDLARGATISASGKNVFDYTLPAFSVSVLVLKP